MYWSKSYQMPPPLGSKNGLRDWDEEGFRTSMLSIPIPADILRYSQGTITPIVSLRYFQRVWIIQTTEYKYKTPVRFQQYIHTHTTHEIYSSQYNIDVNLQIVWLCVTYYFDIRGIIFSTSHIRQSQVSDQTARNHQEVSLLNTYYICQYLLQNVFRTRGLFIEKLQYK